MSKKSRKRNKKILAALALAGGAAMLARGRGKGTAAAEAVSTAGQPVGVDRTMPSTKNWITKKAVVPETKPIIGTGGGGIHQGRPKTLYLEKQARAHLPKGPPGWDNPYTSRVITGRLGARGATGGRVAAKKGGRVTGIAKRGFGRALMKGKK